MLINEILYTSITCCPLCGSQNSEVIRTETNNFYCEIPEQKTFFEAYQKEVVSLLLCQECDFAYVDRLPKENIFFEKLYSQVQYDYSYEFNYHGKKAIYHDIKRQLQKYSPSGILLDIGTWCGTLIAFMADSYSAIGCEISESAASYGKSRGLNIYIGSFDAIEFSTQSFDVITIIDVLEHLPQPKNALAKIFTLLKPGGFLYIKVPNGKAQIKKQNLLQALNLSKEGVGRNFVHINHFNHKSLENVLTSLGFDVLETGYTKPELWDLNFPESINFKIRKWINNYLRLVVTMLVNYISYIFPVDWGFNIYVMAKKPAK